MMDTNLEGKGRKTARKEPPKGGPFAVVNLVNAS